MRAKYNVMLHQTIKIKNKRDMKRNLLIITVLSVVMFVFSCKNADNTENTGESDSSIVDGKPDGISVLTFDPSIVKKLKNIEGTLEYGYSWSDKSGINLLIFTKAEKFVQWKGEEEGMGDKYVYLKVYHFAGNNDDYKLVRMIQDSNQEACMNPPFDLAGNFIHESISITDLDNDNYAEATFMYLILCASELTPVPTKLLMIENGEKYAIRGDSYIKEFNQGGEKNIDFEGAPKEFVDYASKKWDMFCAPNPTGNKTKTFENINLKNPKIEELIGKNFGGVEPNWSIKFKDEGAYYKADIGQPEIFLPYKRIDKTTNIWNIFTSNEQIGIECSINVKKENCSDGMSDYTYPYSIHIEFFDSEKDGCGGNPKY